ncbi:MAG TPA: hypothetical protein VF789_15295 [Thermoanaerobaculia bacterium]
MSRLTRNFAAILLSVTLLAIAAPAAQALPLGKVPPGNAADGSWFGAALTWLSQFLGLQTSGAQISKEKASTGIGSSTTTGGGLTGSCIDPNGCIVVDRGNGNSNGGK